MKINSLIPLYQFIFIFSNGENSTCLLQKLDSAHVKVRRLNQPSTQIRSADEKFDVERKLNYEAEKVKIIVCQPTENCNFDNSYYSTCINDIRGQ